MTETDPLLAIEQALTDDERGRFLRRVEATWPRLAGAKVADVLEFTTSYDMLLAKTEPFFEEHDAALAGLPAVTPALHALIILGGELTMARLTGLLTRAGLMIPDEEPEPFSGHPVQVDAGDLAYLLAHYADEIHGSPDRSHWRLPLLREACGRLAAALGWREPAVTKSGRVVTEEDIARWAVEAERGYDPGQIRGRWHGEDPRA